MAAIKAATVIAEAHKYVGTKESPANSNNVLFNTAYYGRPVSGSAYPWCCVFLWYIFREVGGSSLFYGGQKCAYTPTLANYYKQHGRWYSKPKPGDIVFYKFKGSNRINHVGLVIEVYSDGRIKTIEGNTSSTNDSNGGAVEIRERYTTYVMGYGRPAYASGGGVAPTPSAYNKQEFIRDVEKALGMKVDGIADSNLLEHTVTISSKKNNTHPVVKPVQEYLNFLGYNCGTADGIAGPKFDKAVKKFQTWMTKPDGEITRKGKTWKKLLGL